MKILVVGAGGREHVVVEALAQSPRIRKIYAAPGNGGIREQAELVSIEPDNIEAIADFATAERIDLTFIGPEMPLVAGLADELMERGLPVFGPTRDAAMIEGSKLWARELCTRHGIPGPIFGGFTDPAEAIAFLDQLEAPYVVKADGLAAGKGVTIAETRPEAERAIVERALIVPPGEQIGPITPEQRRTLIQASRVYGHYENAVDRESARRTKMAEAGRRQHQCFGAGGFTARSRSWTKRRRGASMTRSSAPRWPRWRMRASGIRASCTPG